MMTMFLFILAAFLSSLVAGWFTIPRIIVISKRKRLFDTINDRKVHVDSVSRLGGLAFFPSAMFAFSLILGLRYYFGYAIDPMYESSLIKDFFFVLAGLFSIFIIGMADDLVGVSYKPKFMVQVFSSFLLVLAGLNIENLNGLFFVWQMSWLSSAITTVFLATFVLNAFNMIDGIDGLCSGIGSVTLFILGSWFIYLDLYVYAMFAFSMLGVVLAFFRFNFFGKRLKVFMGDTGSLTMGYIIVFLVLKFLSTSASTPVEYYSVINPMAVVIGILFVPCFDVVRVFVNRIYKGKSPFEPDKTHIHHKLMALGIPVRICTFLILIWVIIYTFLNSWLSEIVGAEINYIILIDMAFAITVNHSLNIIRYRRVAKLAQNERK